ncbi:MAG: arsenite methyltransferase [Fimbriimonadaceae bacterium]|uniref:Arsenite methyltransferase n=1 Tax=Candidatus Nitrosymbiomonas proteolyticus TaxID=2608984 RepID=A0A809S8V7_9BACT|nr:arsenite methyltransferase [Fimbriimonadaceae bacterium]NUM39321.1 arsenite methyltransferase [Armatimonadota bacterium]BBO23211.1 arsenite S-adenosylmethyltransferase [Candidatus Nitrosymbiomonas proteolyticus]
MKEPTTHDSPPQIRELVKAEYAKTASKLLEGRASSSSCCNSTGCCESADPISSELYTDSDAAIVPKGALEASLGCGNPTALAQLSEGEVVLDLGSGGGIDVLLSARRVGPNGFVYGLDMTEEMLALAERHKAESGLTNVEFLKGHLEDIPLPDASVDVVISNCVINLSGDKPKALAEAFRVLRPGGRFAVSDMLVEGELSDEVKNDVKLLAGCIAGAVSPQEYADLLAGAGFTGISIEVTRRLVLPDGATCCEDLVETGDSPSDAGVAVLSAFLRASKPSDPL